ncbi:hypothetical protein SAMN04488102_10394 [Alkalibacterium subtropicum]|uniref:O-antigen ligase like membrane protein n=1 Tax=Alkalibacterium subtropicum TaxID=753702 RepID=A0A1I1GN54_9LACT|nr:hypothetical protein [Alkalibacterium subtropicum]SFC11318.1 hypothetical protein SAMN04488102_10394 [Alkalibacterium subtropicum]
MDISFNETNVYRRYPKRWSALFLSLVSLTFLVSDWAILYSSFGDFLLAFAVLLIFLLGKVHIDKKQMLALAVIFTILALTFILSYLYNDYWFSLQRALLSTVKLIFYSVSLVLIYNYIKQNQLSPSFLRLNNGLATIAVVIGILLTLSIYLDNLELPHFVWTFTRQDTRSYLYAGNDAIVRTRSLFSEPAHLGYYLNTLFFANVMDRKVKTKKTVLFILAAGILLTLSYSMILIFVLTSMTLLVSRMLKGEFAWSYWYLAPLVLLGALVTYFWDFIDVTIIERTRIILSGEDGSANIRLFGAWEYVEPDRLLMGNGIGHTPPITNIYAYILSDFGLIGFIPYLGLTLYVLMNSLPAFIFFVMMNMAKGGYLNPAFWLFLLFVFLYGLTKEQQQDRL